jgi:general secretion pathway protein L
MLGRLASGLSAFFTWWGGELAALVPGFVRRRLAGGRGDVIFAFDDGALAVACRSNGRERALGKVPLAGKSVHAVRRAARRLLGRLDPDRVPVVLRVPAGKALVKSIELPIAAEENLAEVVGFEMDRRTPFKVDDVQYDQRVIARDAKAQRITVELALAPKHIVAAALDSAQRWRIWPDRIEVPGDDRPGARRFDLMPRRAEPRLRLRGAVRAVLVGTACALIAAAVLVPLEHKRLIAKHFQEQIAAARAEAAAADALKRELESRLEGGRGVVDERIATPLSLAVLNEVTAVMPDDAWAFQLRLGDGEVQLFGYAAAASQLIGRFEESRLLSEARFRSPITRDPRVGLERFHLSVRVAREASAEANPGANPEAKP